MRHFLTEFPEPADAFLALDAGGCDCIGGAFTDDGSGLPDGGEPFCIHHFCIRLDPDICGGMNAVPQIANTNNLLGTP